MRLSDLLLTKPIRSAPLAEIGLALLAICVMWGVSQMLGLPERLVAASCGTMPPWTPDFVATAEYLDCQRATFLLYWAVITVAVGAGTGFVSRTWLRREQRRDADREKLLDAEMARIRGETGPEQS